MSRSKIVRPTAWADATNRPYCDACRNTREVVHLYIREVGDVVGGLLALGTAHRITGWTAVPCPACEGER